MFYITVSFLGIRYACLGKVLANCDGFVTLPDNRHNYVGSYALGILVSKAE